MSPSSPRRPTLAPWLTVRDPARAVEFYKDAFSATETYAIPGAVYRFSIATRNGGDSEFWIGDESKEHFNFSPESLAGSTVRLILTVDDPDAVFSQACAAGAKVVYPITEAHGWRLGRVVDPFGHHWEIGRELSAEPHA
jgi:PhnB protein